MTVLKRTAQPEPLPMNLMRAHLYVRPFLTLDQQIELTRLIFPADSFEDWLQGIRDGQSRPT